MGVELFLAIKYLKAKNKERFLSVTIRFALIGIMLGVATLIVVTSVMNGFKTEIIEKLVSFNGHVNVYSREGISDHKQYQKMLASHKAVKEYVMSIKQNVILSVAGEFDGAVGVAEIVGNLKYDVIAGSKPSTDSNLVGIGSIMAKKYTLNIGDEITLITAKMDNTVLGDIPISKTFKVGYIFRAGMHQYDSQVVLLSKHYAELLFGLTGKVTDIHICLKDYMQTSDIINTLKNVTPHTNDVIYDWKSANLQLLQAVQVERNVMFIILTLIIFVAGFNIITSMVMLIKDKAHDIAILRTIGYSKYSIMKVFLYAGGYIGVVGISLGALLGIIISLNIDRIKSLLEVLLKFELFPSEVYYLLELPSKIESREVLYIVGVALIITFISALLPALKASRMNPVDILRHE